MFVLQNVLPPPHVHCDKIPWILSFALIILISIIIITYSVRSVVKLCWLPSTSIPKRLLHPFIQSSHATFATPFERSNNNNKPSTSSRINYTHPMLHYHLHPDIGHGHRAQQISIPISLLLLYISSSWFNIPIVSPSPHCPRPAWMCHSSLHPHTGSQWNCKEMTKNNCK